LKFNYSWSAIPGDDPRISGKPDSTLLNRNEGYEVLYFINKFAELNNLQSKESCLKIELMIIKHLPGDIRSQEKVMGWINSNWDKY